MKYCQGPSCHRYFTKDRLRGPQGNKTYQTRKRTHLLFNLFCSQRCQRDWINRFGEQAVNHFGRIHEPIRLTEDNAWRKLRRYYNSRNLNNFYWYNGITEQELPLTEQQYNDEELTQPS